MAPRKTSPKKATKAAKAASAPRPAPVMVPLEIRIAGKIAFLQPVDKASIDLTYIGEALTLSASTNSDGSPTQLEDLLPPVTLPLPPNIPGAFPMMALPPEAVDPPINPDVIARVHYGERPAEQHQQSKG